MKTNRIKLAGLALATVVGTNAMLFTPTYASEGDISVIDPQIADIVYGEDVSFQAVTINVKNNSNSKQSILGCKTNKKSDFVATSSATPDAPIEVKAKEKSADSGCKVTLKETGHKAGENLSGVISVQFKTHNTVYNADIELDVDVIKKSLDVPSAENLVYNGELQTTTFSPAIDSDLIEVTGDVSGTNVGTYAYTLALKDSENYQWNTEHGKTRDKEGSWKIKVAEIDPTLTIEDWTYGDTASEPVVTGNLGDGKVAFIYFGQGYAPSATMPTDAGEYGACVNIAKTRNTAAGRACTTFAIDQRDVTVTVTGKNATFIYDGLAKTVSGYSATISDALYESGFYSVSGTAMDSLSATEVGVYTGSLSAEDFTNHNENFNVTFDVTPHTLVIEEAPVKPVTPITPVTPAKKASAPMTPDTGVWTENATASTAAKSSSLSSVDVIVVTTMLLTTCGGVVVARKLRR